MYTYTSKYNKYKSRKITALFLLILHFTCTFKHTRIFTTHKVNSLLQDTHEPLLCQRYFVLICCWLLMFYFLVACSLTCSFIEIQHFRIIILCINSKIVSMCVLPWVLCMFIYFMHTSSSTKVFKIVFQKINIFFLLSSCPNLAFFFSFLFLFLNLIFFFLSFSCSKSSSLLSLLYILLFVWC